MNIFASDMMDSFRETCVVIEKTITEDDTGGYNTVWREGVNFDAYFENDTSTQANIADQQGYNATYSVYVDKSMKLEVNDVFMRKSDGMKFRINRETPEKKTPNTSTLGKRLILCEKWEYPINVSDG